MTRLPPAARTTTCPALVAACVAILVAQVAGAAGASAATIAAFDNRASPALPIHRVASPTARDPVAALYARYGLGGSGRGFSERDAAHVFTRSLLALYKQAVASGNLDYDFFVQGQDFSLVKPVELSVVHATGSTAEIGAILVQNDTDKTGKAITRRDKLLFVVRKEAGGWRIDDASHDGKSVRQEWREMIRGR